MKNPRVIFAGTPEFARASLSALVDSGVVPVAVLTQPDRRSGRGKKITASPVKRYAEEHGIPVMQPVTLRDDNIVAELEALEPDLIIVAAYGLILPQTVLDIPSRGCLNVHASVLPRWRGAAPIQAAILAGDEYSGVSLMSMTAGLDCGPVFASQSIGIDPEESAGDLHDRLAKLGGELLVENLDEILEQRIAAVPQDDSAASYAGKIKTSDAQLDWSQDANELARRVRAFNPVPGAFFFVGVASDSDTLRIKCWRAHGVDDVNATPGVVVSSGAEGVVVACGSGALCMTELQLPGRRRVQANEFADQLDLCGQDLG